MISSIRFYLIKIKLQDAKKINYKTQDNNHFIYKSKSCRAAEFSKVLNGAQSWSCFKHWWFADWSSWLREPLIFFDNKLVVHRSLFPRKEEIVEWLSHISRVRRFGLVHSHMLGHFLHHLYFSKLVLCRGYLRYMMFVEIHAHHLHHVPDLVWDVRSCHKKSTNNFSHWICTKSAENSTVNISLLFCTEKIRSVCAIS